MHHARLKPLHEQVVVLTGASSGIGLATAYKAAARGASLVLAARSGDVLERVASELRQRGAKIATVTADVSKPEDVKRIARTALDSFGHIDTWINNAGVSAYGRLPDIPIEDQHRIFDINYWGVVYGSLEALEHMRYAGGKIINLGSVLSDVSMPWQVAYSASKHAVKGFTDGLRGEIINEDLPVSVTLIKPAAIDTPYKEHAANYLDREPDNPPPIYAPEMVADTILYAATHHARDLWVGGAGRGMSLFRSLCPVSFDHILAKVMTPTQRSTQMPRGGHKGLHEATQTGRIRGQTHRPVMTHCPYTWAERNKTTVLAGMALLAGLCLALKMRR